MVTHEWALSTPRTKEFELIETREVLVGEPFVQEDGTPGMRQITKTVFETVVHQKQANIVRLDKTINEDGYQRMFVRFFYGYLESGKFVPARLDDGVVFSGPTYIEHEFHKETPSEEELLNKVAAVLKWDGGLRQIS